ncbi:DUF6233 domain-containing protein [Streptomyces sp. NPDC021562]|uniref:DUF6233 domain-containing protein n=1 Tax=Streptomyces sp. NPDC021562 TaxID=3155121 RepID=UPI0033FA5513
MRAGPKFTFSSWPEDRCPGNRHADGLRQRQTEAERGRARRPPAPDWVLELNRTTGHPMAVHVGDCGMANRRRNPVGRDEARRLLTTDGIPACPICRPDAALGIADQGLSFGSGRIRCVSCIRGGSRMCSCRRGSTCRC